MTSSPHVDQLLHLVNKMQTRENRGKLKIFLGMCAGVGKTYAMLQAAQKAQEEGVDVWVGYVETHGRKETEALLLPLKQFPRLTLTYRETEVQTFDLDAVLDQKPQWVLVDELAHSNVPGQRHAKRYQDVLELLEAGINVYTTLNIQHLESRADVVQSITGNPVHERVPDSILDEASEVQLIDISPDDLLLRLKAGKIYTPENSVRAGQHFFQTRYLTALREIALRLTAEQVDQSLKEHLGQRRNPGIWQVNARLMVAVGPGPGSAALVRLTRRMAHQMGSEWLAVHVETEKNDSKAAQDSLRKNIDLAKRLGAKVVYVKGSRLHPALLQAAEQNQATQLIMGKPRHSFWRDLLTGSLRQLYQLFYQSKNLDIWMVDSYKETVVPPSKWQQINSISANQLHHFGLVFLSLSLVSGIGYLLLPFVGYQSVGLLFLLALVTLALFVPYSAITLGATLSAMAWNFFFIPPLFTFYIRDVHNILMCLLYFAVALFIGNLVHRIKKEEHLGKQREERLFLLYQFHQEVLSEPDEATLIDLAQKTFAQYLNTPVQVTVEPTAFEHANTQEEAVRNWVYRNKERAGASTDTLSVAKALYLPIQNSQAIYGVLHFEPPETLTSSQLNLLETLMAQLAARLENLNLQKQSQLATLDQMSDALYEDLLNSVSHELRTPITSIRGVVHNLQDVDVQKNPELSAALLQELDSASRRLNHIVANLLDASRLQSGKLVLNEAWHDLGDIVRAGVAPLKQTLDTDYDFKLLLSADAAPVWGDFGLLEQVVHNLVYNAIFYNPSGCTLSIEIEQTEKHWRLWVKDKGVGINPHDLPHLFEKFYRGQEARAGGTGLGLSICKGIIEAHGGTIAAYNDSGAVFKIQVPMKPLPQLPVEEPE